MVRPKNPNGNKARIDGMLRGLVDRLGIKIEPYIVPNTKMKAALLGDVYITSSVSNSNASIIELRRRYRNSTDRLYAISAHIYAAGMESERVEMSVDHFLTLISRLIEKDPSYYLRKNTHAKDKDE